MFEMLCGMPPFEGDTEEDLFQSVLDKTVVYPKSLSKDATSIIKGVGSAEFLSFSLSLSHFISC